MSTVFYVESMSCLRGCVQSHSGVQPLSQVDLNPTAHSYSYCDPWSQFRPIPISLAPLLIELFANGG